MRRVILTSGARMLSPVILVMFATLATLAVSMPVALAQGWPSRPVTLVAPTSPGGSPDVFARLIADRLGPQLGQQVVVVNRPGAGTTIGTESVARAAPDGYTLLIGTSTNVINPHLSRKLPYSLDDFVFVSSIAAAADVMLVHPSQPMKTFAELVTHVRANPGAPFAHPGIGTSPHLTTELLMKMANVQITHVPFNGGGAALNGLVSGQVAMGFLGSAAYLPRRSSGQLRPLAVSTAKRLSSAPDLPTVAESGYPGFENTSWFGIFAPARTPQEIVDRLSDETRKALQQPDLRDRILALGSEPLGSTPAEFTAMVRAEYERWGKLIAQTGIRLD